MSLISTGSISLDSTVKETDVGKVKILRMLKRLNRKCQKAGGFYIETDVETWY
jgi:hypothetical protein